MWRGQVIISSMLARDCGSVEGARYLFLAMLTWDCGSVEGDRYLFLAMLARDFVSVDEVLVVISGHVD